MRLWGRKGFWYRVKYRNRTKRKYNTYLFYTVMILFIFYSFSLFDQKIKPTVVAVAEARARHLAIMAINETVNKKMSEDEIQYDDLITFQKDNTGKITALQANTVVMNQLKSVLSMDIQEKIISIDSTVANVPIGNIINSHLFSGWGPRLPVRLIPVGNAHMNFKSVFETAGINQTKHQIVLEVHSRITVLLPLFRKGTEVITTVPLAETIIIGDVPNQYINVEGTKADPPDKVLDLLN